MIEVKNLTKYYGDVLAIDHLTFTAKKGRILGFLGPNGSGKTTTMRILSCCMFPSDGTVHVDGLDSVTHSLAIRRMLGYLPETPPLYVDMNVDEYLTYAAQIKGVPRDKLRARLDTVKDTCGLHEVSRTLIRALSKGYRQRVGIAQSLIHDPQILIMDEPTVGLDPRQINDIRMLIKSLSSGRTVIISTHILPEVTLICDDILIISRGRLVFQDAVSSIESHTDLERLFLQCTDEAQNKDTEPRHAQ